MSTLSWTDAIGAASLDNAKPYPGSRFANWEPNNNPFGVRSHTLATGALNVTAFRDDLTVSLDVQHIPNTDMGKMLRLQMHLKRGGSVTLDTSPDTTIPVFGTCKLAPGADVQIQLTDKTTLEYTVSTVLRGAAGSFITTPDGTTDFLIWFKADIPAWPSLALPADASALGQWNDVTGNGNHGVAPMASMKPRFDLVAQNGLPGVHFDANNYGDPSWNEVDRFVLPWGALLPAQFTSVEGFLVCKRETAGFASGGPWEMGSGNAGATQNGHYPQESGPDVGHVIDTFGSNGQQSAGIPGINLYQAHIYNPASTYTNTWQARFNGVLTADRTGTGYGVPDPAIANTACQVGNAKPGGDNAFHGWFYEVIVYSPKRTPTQRAAITSYLANKWGITI